MGASSGLGWKPVLGSPLPWKRETHVLNHGFPSPVGSDLCLPLQPHLEPWSLLPISLFPTPSPSLSWSFPLLEALLPWCLMWPVPAHSSGLNFHVYFLRAAFSGHPVFSRSPDLCADSVFICFLHGLLSMPLSYFTLLLIDSLSVGLHHLAVNSMRVGAMSLFTHQPFSSARWRVWHLVFL